jgi:hypothetical protein
MSRLPFPQKTAATTQAATPTAMMVITRCLVTVLASRFLERTVGTFLQNDNWQKQATGLIPLARINERYGDLSPMMRAYTLKYGRDY